MKTFKNNMIMIKYVAKFCPLYIISSFFAIIASSVSSLIEVMIVEKVINLVLEEKADFNIIVKELILFFGILILSLIVKRIHYGYLVARNRHLWVKKIQRVMFEKAAKLDIASFDNPKEYDLFHRALTQGDLKGINTFDAFVHFLINVAKFFTIGIYIVIKDPLLLIAVVVQSTVAYIIQYKNNKMWYKTSKEMETNQRRYGYIKRVFYLEKYTCDIKTTNLPNLLIEKEEEVRVNLDKGYRDTDNKGFLYNILEDITSQIVRNFVVYVYLMWKVYKNIINIASFAASVNAILRVTNYIYGVVWSMGRLRDNALYIDDFLWLMNYQPKVEDSGGKKLESTHPVIEIEHVGFKYPDQEEYVLQDINLKIEPREKIAIIGYNGAGKTTLIKLLLKFYHVSEGDLKIDGNSFLDVDEKEIRKMYVSLFQNFQIYSVSVLENVLLRSRKYETDDEVVWEALKKAGLYDKIMATEKKLDTIMTKEFDDKGLVLSGGEQQKLAIARVFAADTPIIILDEPTSSLDPISEYEINKKILKLYAEKTVILISHRLSTVVDANKIYMMEKGRIIEQGNHIQLMKKKGKYYEMFETQAHFYQESQEQEKSS